MTKEERIKTNISKEFKLNDIDTNDFYNHAKRYIKAIKENRMICNIDKVSKSGMSRNIKFLECHKNTYNNGLQYQYLNFYYFFNLLGYSEVKRTGTFRIYGCGMDMIFDTNYTIIHRLKRLGFISQRQCSDLTRMTPSVI